ncbi:uncharacterized protein LOC122065729 [Macadamia integrifolia]|uniref:uncharacterized protein LOC122065729 n=1 Tax=Macadamia integrifolia TaxID=60698 RepID=UPI001C4F4744|nr:uncharacterized protein LOC122065729 [Macadamia integrifolia]
MEEVFVKSVENGLKLSRRIYFGKDRDVLPPKLEVMEINLHSYLPTAPMVYAVIYDPSIVDTPDIRSYQPHVYGCCDPPALIPLQMNGIAIEVECYLDTAIITVSGSWRVHCVIGSSSCDCCLAIPMSEKIDGWSNLSIKVSWSQKIFYSNDQFSLDIPFSFPEYVTPFVKRISKIEKIQLNVNYDMGTEILCKTTSHPLKEIRRQAGNLGFLYEADVLTWSKTDFNISYMVKLHLTVIDILLNVVLCGSNVISNEISSGLLLQSPSVHDFDQREIFCFYLFPGNHQHRKIPFSSDASSFFCMLISLFKKSCSRLLGRIIAVY